MQRAFTFIETLLSFTLLALVLMLVLNIFPSSVASVRTSEQRYRADRMAASLLEGTSTLPFSQLAVGYANDLPVQVWDSVEYHIHLEVAQANGDPQFLRALRATVSWTVKGETRQVVREIWIHRLPSQQ